MAITASPWALDAVGPGYVHPQVVDLGDGTYLRVSVEQDGHYGRASLVCYRSTVLGTWTDKRTIATDETYTIGFPSVVQLASGRIVVWALRRTIDVPLTYIDNGYSYTDDGGLTWSGYISRGALLTGVAPCSQKAVEVDGAFYVPSYVQDKLRIYATTDGMAVASTIIPVPDVDAATHKLNEWALAYGDGLWVLGARNAINDAYPSRPTEHGVHVAFSTDGATYSPITNINLPDGWCSHPAMVFVNGVFYLMVGDREGTSGGYTAPFNDDKLWIYSTTAARLQADVSDWTLEASIARPWVAGTEIGGTTVDGSFYGYPQLFDTGGGEMFVSVTESDNLGVVPSNEYTYHATLSGFPVAFASFPTIRRLVESSTAIFPTIRRLLESRVLFPTIRRLWMVHSVPSTPPYTTTEDNPRVSAMDSTVKHTAVHTGQDRRAVTHDSD